MRTIHENNNGLSIYEQMLRASKKRHAVKQIIEPIEKKVVPVKAEAEPQIKKQIILSGQDSALLAQLFFIQVPPGRLKKSKLPDNYFHKLIISELRFLEVPPGRLKKPKRAQPKIETPKELKTIVVKKIPKPAPMVIPPAEKEPFIRAKGEYTNRSPYGIASDYILESNRRH
jgi:hypothetical protein